MDDRERLAVLQQFGRTYWALMGRFEAEVGHPMPRWRILIHLYEQASPCAQKHLVEQLRVDPGALTRQLKTLEKMGWISRATDPRDNRVSNVVLTPQGRMAVREAMPRRERFLQGTLTAIPDDALQALAHGARMLEQQLAPGRQDEAASPAATDGPSGRYPAAAD